jgi:two-component system, OmpR family, phosphate regulon sensor histidine kinase PhoR
MPWRNSILFFVILFPALAVFALAGIVAFYALPPVHRPVLLWYGSIALALTSLVCALFFGLRLKHRLQALYQFITVTSRQDPPPSLPVWDEDEVGALERGLQHLVSRHYDWVHALQGERKKLEAVLQGMAEGVVVIDPVGHVVLCNQASQELFALNPAGDWQGKPLPAFSRHPALPELLREVASRRPSDPPVTCEIDIEGERPRHLAVSAVQVSEDGATVSGYVLVFHDLTRIKRLEAIRADFVANVSHELRTPLTAIKGYAETLLGSAGRDPETAGKFLSIIDRHAGRLSRLIDDLLTLSDLELGKVPLRKEEVFMGELVEEVLETLRDKADKGRVTLDKDLPEALPPLLGDGDRLHQVLINLVDNAVKYTPTGGMVTVRAKTVPGAECGPQSQAGVWNGGDQASPLRPEDFKLEEQWLEVAVSDTGCGIPEKELPRLTQRFYRVDKARSRELGGTGLGLAIVKHIVQAHRGLLHIESRVNQGTTVQVFLPVPH